jgi:hypothetical protein
MQRKISIYDFDFRFTGYGHYYVTFTSRITGKKWSVTTNDMPLIDATKNEAYPKIKDLIKLKRICKR